MQIELSELAALIGNQPAKALPFKVGETYIIRTVTYHAVGRVDRIVGDFLVLVDASWVADSGRWNNALREGKLSEVEPFPGECIVNTQAIVDATAWRHDLPREQLPK